MCGSDVCDLDHYKFMFRVSAKSNAADGHGETHVDSESVTAFAGSNRLNFPEKCKIKDPIC